MSESRGEIISVRRGDFIGIRRRAPALRTDVPEKLYQWPLARQRVLQSSWPRTCGLDSPTGIVAVKHVPPLSELSRSEAKCLDSFRIENQSTSQHY